MLLTGLGHVMSRWKEMGEGEKQEIFGGSGVWKKSKEKKKKGRKISEKEKKKKTKEKRKKTKEE